MPEDRVNIDGLSIRYWTNVGGLGGDLAKGKTLVLFHGNSLSLDSWKKSKTLEALASRGHRVFAIDLPAGKGSLSDKLSPKVLKSDPNRIMMVLDKSFDSIGVGDSPFTIVGPSMGGGFALAYALYRPERVSALVLVSPSTYRIPEQEKVRLSGLKMPILLIWGERDRVFPLEEFGIPLSRTLSNARLKVVEQAGHGVYLDKPGEFNSLLLEFISDVV